MKKVTAIFCLFAMFKLSNIQAQQNVGIGTTTPDSSAALEIKATGKGMLVPRMTFANRPTSPATGLLYYQTDVDSGFYFYNGSAWKQIKQDPLLGNGNKGRMAVWDSANQLISSSKLLFDTTTNRMGIGTDSLGNNMLFVKGVGGLKASTTNPGSSTSDWIAVNAGGSAGDRVVSGNLNGNATIAGHNNALTAWSDLTINQGGGKVIIGGQNLTPPSGGISSSFARPLVVNGSVRQSYYFVNLSISAYDTFKITWTHNLGYNPIVMMSANQDTSTGGMENCTYTSYPIDGNNLGFIVKNQSSSSVYGNFRWILVY